MFSLLRFFGARRMTQLVRRAPLPCLPWHGDRCRRWSQARSRNSPPLPGPAPGCMCAAVKGPGSALAQTTLETLDALVICPLQLGSCNAPVASRGSGDARPRGVTAALGLVMG